MVKLGGFYPGAHLLGMVLDLVGALLLALYALLIGPLGVLRGPIVLERFFWYCGVLLPQGGMTRAIRVAIDWRLGRFDAAIAQLEGLVSQCEDYRKAKPASVMRSSVLGDLYTVLARAYLHAGQLDEAMLVVIRAKKCMGIERLPGLVKLDAKTAHLVRAGLAAGRLLDGGGLATMFVKSTSSEPPVRPGLGRGLAPTGASRSKGDEDKRAGSPHRAGAVRDGEQLGIRSGEGDETGAGAEEPSGKIIPFRPREL